ncbi:MAG: hypothetical protein ACPGQM_05820 [Alphaproteobacteria bacterium]
MLNTVERSLRFVSLLGIGDPIPPEILTGDASWQPSRLRRDAALKKIGACLTAWQMGKPVALSDLVNLERFVAAHVDDVAVDVALGRIASELGDYIDGDAITEIMDAVVEEISFIEALRERYLAVCRVGGRLKKVRRDFAHHASIVSDVDPVARLISVPIHAMGRSLAEVDTRLSRIVSLFENFEFHRCAIRDIRDEIFARLDPWDEITKAWERLPGNIPDPYVLSPLLRDLYKYLAPRFMPADTWARLLAEDTRLDENRHYGSVTTWFECGD